MLSIDQCRKILNSKKKTYSDEQVKQISRFVDTLAQVWANHQLKEFQDEENSGDLHKGVNGSAS
jgi:hypothetical protein